MNSIQQDSFFSSATTSSFSSYPNPYPSSLSSLSLSSLLSLLLLLLLSLSLYCQSEIKEITESEK